MRVLPDIAILQSHQYSDVFVPAVRTVEVASKAMRSIFTPYFRPSPESFYVDSPDCQNAQKG
jgi:hypothetical protein